MRAYVLMQSGNLQIYNGMGKALLDYETAVLHVETMAEDGVRDLDALLGPLEQARLNFESCWHVANMLQLVTGLSDRDFLSLKIELMNIIFNPNMNNAYKIIDA